MFLQSPDDSCRKAAGDEDGEHVNCGLRIADLLRIHTPLPNPQSTIRNPQFFRQCPIDTQYPH
jgi:hypothetical protein